MVKVYFESNSHAELVAVFDSEESYDNYSERLEKEANDARMVLTESVDETSINDISFPSEQFKHLLIHESRFGAQHYFFTCNKIYNFALNESTELDEDDKKLLEQLGIEFEPDRSEYIDCYIIDDELKDMKFVTL